MKVLQIKIFDKPKQCLNFEEFDVQINSYLNTIESIAYPDPFLFWKCHEGQFPQLAKLAKKYLAVPASSAAVEHMFSFHQEVKTYKK